MLYSLNPDFVIKLTTALVLFASVLADDCRMKDFIGNRLFQNRCLPQGQGFVIRVQGWFKVEIQGISSIVDQLAWTTGQMQNLGLLWQNQDVLLDFLWHYFSHLLLSVHSYRKHLFSIPMFLLLLLFDLYPDLHVCL
jgi:hypothetical protein